MTARVRRRCCRQMNLSPSATSARRLVPCSRGTRNRPCSSSITPTATAHSATDDAKAAATPTATSSPPSAGPMNSLAVSSAAWRRPLARESRLRGTTCGRIDWAHVSWTVSAAPRNSATAYSAQIDPLPNSTAATSTPRPDARTTFAVSIAARRSTRSASAPAGSANNSHGSVTATPTPATSAGESVSVTATNGNATLTTPSARFDRVEDDHSCQKARPRGSGRPPPAPNSPPARHHTIEDSHID